MAVLLRGDFDASRLRGLTKTTEDGPQAGRLLALSAIYAGATLRSREDLSCRSPDHPGLGVPIQGAKDQGCVRPWAHK